MIFIKIGESRINSYNITNYQPFAKEYSGTPIRYGIKINFCNNTGENKTELTYSSEKERNEVLKKLDEMFDVKKL